MADPTPTRPPDEQRDDLVALLVAATGGAAERLAHGDHEPSAELLREAVMLELRRATGSDPGLRVRADRSPRQRGAWRFSVLMEAPDRVMAAIEISGAVDAVEHEAMSLARLSLAVGRGVAERGFLVAASHAGRGLAGSVASASGRPGALSSPFLTRFTWRDTPWQIAVTEARSPRSDETGGFWRR